MLATQARNQLCPLLEHLQRELRAEGRDTRCAVFARIQRQLDGAQDAQTLAEPLLRLTSYCALNGRLASQEPLIELVLQRVASLQGQLRSARRVVH